MSIKKIFKKYILPVATLSGGIVGVGIFSLPYIALKSGVWPMIGYFLLMTFLVVVIHLIFAEISLKTPDYKRFPGFVKHHLGKTAGAIAMLATVIGSFAVLLAYLVVGSGFLAAILSIYFDVSYFACILLYFFAAGMAVWMGIKAVSKFELAALVLLVLSLVAIFISGFSKMSFSNISPLAESFSFGNFFLPYGAILFALWGAGMIPEVEEMVSENKKSVKKIVVISTLIPAVIYIFFTFMVLAITGKNTTESALVGLKDFLGDGVYITALFAGVAATFTAFISQALTLKKVFMYDLKIKHGQAFVMTCFTPLVFLLSGINSFILIVSFTGGVLLGINGILILMMYKKIGGKKIVTYPLSAIFILGVLYEIIYFIN